MSGVSKLPIRKLRVCMGIGIEKPKGERFVSQGKRGRLRGRVG